MSDYRRDLLNHFIVFNDRHLKWLMAKYVDYYHGERTHLGLGKETHAGREGGESRCWCEGDLASKIGRLAPSV